VAFTYAYLLSAPHSGSTLLACLLASHPQVSSVGEFTSDWVRERLQCSCGAPFPECPLWRRWADLAHREGIEFDITNPQLNIVAKPGAGFWEDLFFHYFAVKLIDRVRDAGYWLASKRPRQTAHKLERAVRLGEILCREQRTDVFFDSSKNPIQVRWLSTRRGLRLKVISLVRDGRGVMYSLMKHYGHSPERAIDFWLWSIRNQQRVVSHYVPAQDVLTYRMEDFCVQPQDHLAGLHRFLGIAPDLALDYSDASRRHITGNKMRKKFDGQIQQDNAWRGSLSAAQIRLFEARAGAVNRQLGYLD
jgi:hypothetical protein